MFTERMLEANSTTSEPLTGSKRHKGNKTVKAKRERLRGGKHNLSHCVDPARKTRKHADDRRPTGFVVHPVSTPAVFDVSTATTFALSRLGRTNPDVDDVVQSASLIWFTRANRGDARSAEQCVTYAIRRLWRERSRETTRRKTDAERAILKQGRIGGRKDHTGIGVKLATDGLRPQLAELATLLATGANTVQCAQLTGVSQPRISQLIDELSTFIDLDTFAEPSDTIGQRLPRSMKPFHPCYVIAPSHFVGDTECLPPSLDRPVGVNNADYVSGTQRVEEATPSAPKYSYDHVLQFAHDLMITVTTMHGNGEGV